MKTKKSEKQNVLKGLEKLRDRIVKDHQVWAELYDDSGAQKYMKKHNDEYWTLSEIIAGGLGLDNILHHIEYIESMDKNEK